jgi:hypothetical protein
MYRAWLGLKARAWAWLWWAWAFKIVSQARIEGLPKPGAWLGLKPGLVYHIWLLLQKALKCVAERERLEVEKVREIALSSVMEIIQISSSQI